jgi:hypothetical protein
MKSVEASKHPQQVQLQMYAKANAKKASCGSRSLNDEVHLRPSGHIVTEVHHKLEIPARQEANILKTIKDQNSFQAWLTKEEAPEAFC